MVATPSTMLELGTKAPFFRLIDSKNREPYSLNPSPENGLLVAFICNHCPYVIRALDDMKYEAQALQNDGIEVIAICSNDPIKYPDDGFDKMQKFAVQNTFNFPYLHDEDQSVARAYDAQCTPDFFGFNSALSTGDGNKISY